MFLCALPAFPTVREPLRQILKRGLLFQVLLIGE